MHGQWSKEKIEIFITLLKEIACIEESHGRLKIVLEDPDDDKFFHTALNSGLNSGAKYIVSRDVHLLSIKEFGGIRVLNPEVFLTALRKNSL